MVYASLVLATEEDPGTSLYKRSDVGRRWTDGQVVDLQCRMVIGSLVPTKIPTNSDIFLNYIELVKNVSNIKLGLTTKKKRAMVMVADAIGGYLYSKLLPNDKMLYYDGKASYVTTQRLYNLMKKIK